MKNLYPKSSSAVLKLCIALLVTSVAIIYGCKKEHTDNKDAPSTPDTQTIADAKSWFEKTYPAVSSSGQSNHTNSTGTDADLSQRIKPDWQHTATYARLGKDVIEMPIAPDSKFGSILKKKVNNHIYSKMYTRSSYLLLKGAKGYQAYIMTIVGDSSYIKDDPGKLANNTYRQHDADFSGLVLYFTPKGKYLNGYAYKNGQLVTPVSQSQSTPGKIKVQLVLQCTDWYEDVYVNNVLVMSVYLYTTCAGVNPDDPNSSGSPAPPDLCDPAQQPPTGPESPSTPNPPTGPIIPTAIPGGQLTVNNVPGGGGFLPPSDEDDPCPEPVPDNIETDCSSFNFTKTSIANWQEAGVRNIRLKWVWLGGQNNGMIREVYLPQAVFGLPTQYQNSNGSITTLSPGAAAVKAARATEAAKTLTYIEFRNSPYLPNDATVLQYFRQQLQIQMALQQGTAGVTGSGSGSILFNNEERSSFFPSNCDQ